MCSAFIPRVAHVQVLLIELGIHSVYGFFSSSGLCRIFAYRTSTVWSAFFARVAYIGVLLLELGTHRF